MNSPDPIPPKYPNLTPVQASGVEIAPGVRVAETAIRWHFSRSGGPGGQNVNKVNTKAEIWVPLERITGLSDAALARLRALSGKRLTLADEIHIASDTGRTQEVNRMMVMERLRELLVEAQRAPRKRRKSKPSRAARQRRLDSKRKRSQIKSLRSRSRDD